MRSDADSSLARLEMLGAGGGGGRAAAATEVVAVVVAEAAEVAVGVAGGVLDSGASAIFARASEPELEPISHR